MDTLELVAAVIVTLRQRAHQTKWCSLHTLVPMNNLSFFNVARKSSATNSFSFWKDPTLSREDSTRLPHYSCFIRIISNTLASHFPPKGPRVLFLPVYQSNWDLRWCYNLFIISAFKDINSKCAWFLESTDYTVCFALCVGIWFPLLTHCFDTRIYANKVARSRFKAGFGVHPRSTEYKGLRTCTDQWWKSFTLKIQPPGMGKAIHWNKYYDGGHLLVCLVVDTGWSNSLVIIQRKVSAIYVIRWDIRVIATLV